MQETTHLQRSKHASPIKIIQWATGAMGKSCMRGVIDAPNLKLVGLYAYDKHKIGKTAGQIAHRDCDDVVATNDIDAILELDADLVIHAARIGAKHTDHDDDICRLLASGKNVLSINGNSYPESWPEARKQKFLEATNQGNSSFMGGGLNPGFAAERLLNTACKISTHIERVELSEIVITDQIQSADYVFDKLCFGAEIGSVDLTSDDFAPAVTLNGLFEDVIHSVAHNMGWNLEGIQRKHKMLPAAQAFDIAAGTIQKGTASHIDWTWHGIVDGEDKIHLSISWAMNADHLNQKDNPVWSIKITGTPNVLLSLDMERPESLPGRTSAEQLAVASSVVNAIPFLVNQPAGLVPASGCI